MASGSSREELAPHASRSMATDGVFQRRAWKERACRHASRRNLDRQVPTEVAPQHEVRRLFDEGSRPPVAAVAFALPHRALCFLAAVCRERAADLVLRFGEFPVLAADVTLVAGMGLDQLSCHLCPPE